MADQIYTRLFTVDEANDLVPALSALIKRIFDRLDSLKKKSEHVIREEGRSPKISDLARCLQKSHEIAGLTDQIHERVEEIHSHGCLYRGLEQGLADFPCLFATGTE
jgi:hypothetical protein